MASEGHRERAEAAYGRYRRLQERIDAYEQRVGAAYPHNDRLVADHLKNSDEPDAWVYRTLCKKRAVEEQIIATETAMFSLYQ